MRQAERQRTIREFLIAGFAAVAAATVVVSCVLGVYLMRSQMASVEVFIRQRVEHSIAVDRNELLDEIALNDTAALQEHLNILSSTLDLDSIVLTRGSDRIAAGKGSTSRGVLLRLLVPRDERPLAIPIANDYGNFNARLEIVYRDQAIRQAIHPILVPLAGTLACLLLLELLAFLAVFKLIDLKLIRPIQHLARSFKTDPPAALPEPSFGSVPLKEIEDLRSSLNRYKELRDSALAGELARQLAHDIRSPLAALDSVLREVSQLPEESRVIVRGAVGRIHDIANGLMERIRAPRAAEAAPKPEPLVTELLSSLIAPLLTEKRLQFRSRIGVTIEGLIDASSYGLFADVQPVEFKRVLSNLVSNAVEAVGEEGRVLVSLCRDGDETLLEVVDNGKGIPRELLGRLGRKGETYGKTGGTGLGLYHAKTHVESWRGRLEIQSQLGRGTTVSIRLPPAASPSWFVSRLELEPGSAVVVLDDDATIHHVWRGRLESVGARGHDIDVLHFSTPGELRAWIRASASKAESAVYLTDYELLGHAETGLSLMKEHGLGKRSILVTSRSEDPALLEQCRGLKMRMIPKGLAGFVPIEIRTSSAAKG